jgi:pimeloyl-ACP methyl ester carboxylesterase
MSLIKVNNVDLSVRDYGDPPGNRRDPIVFLHAFPLDQTMWNEQVTDLRSECRVVTFDWRGFGESTSGVETSSMDLFADDLAALLDQLKIQRAVVCGLSMGGYAAFAFHRRHKERIAALVLANTRAGADSPEGRQSRLEMARLVRRSGTEAIADTMLSRLLGPSTRNTSPETVESVRRTILRNRPEPVAQALVGMAGRPDSTDMLGLIDIPVLVIAGTEDAIITADEMEAMASLIPNAEFRRIETAGHLSNIEQPAIFSRSVIEFLEKARTAA